MKCLVYAQPDGTAVVITPIAYPGETEADTLARVAGEHGLGDLWDAVSPEVVAALRRADTPAPGALIPVESFRERIAPAYIAMASASPAIQAKWDRLVRDFLPPGRPPVNLASPTTAALLALAVADGLLTEQQAAAVTAVG